MTAVTCCDTFHIHRVLEISQVSLPCTSRILGQDRIHRSSSHPGSGGSEIFSWKNLTAPVHVNSEVTHLKLEVTSEAVDKTECSLRSFKRKVLSFSNVSVLPVLLEVLVLNDMYDWQCCYCCCCQALNQLGQKVHGRYVHILSYQIKCCAIGLNRSEK